MLVVGKQYNLNNVKEIKVTEEFISLKKDATKCQNKESFDDCTSRLYMEALMTQCKCRPFAIRQKGNVKFSNLLSNFHPNLINCRISVRQ